MWILLVILLNLPFYSCEPKDCDNRYNHFDSELYLEINSDKRITVCIYKNESERNYEYYAKTQITVKCKRKIPLTPKDSSSPVTLPLQWKMQIFDEDLLKTEAVKLSSEKYTEVSTMIFNLDNDDQGLLIRCSSHGINDVIDDHVSAKFKLSQNPKPPRLRTLSDNNFEPKSRNFTDGQKVPNEEKNPIVLYKGPRNDLTVDKIIKPGQNIFDRIKLKDNGTVYSIWKIQEVKSERIYVTKKNFIVNTVLRKVTDSEFPVYVIVLLVLGLISTLFALFCLYYKCCKRRETPDDTSDHIYTEPMQDIYAQVELEHSNTPAPKRAEQPYAKIIGTYMPKRNRPPLPARNNETR